MRACRVHEITGQTKWRLPGQRGRLNANSDLKKLPTEDEVASAILFMASDLSSGITGQALDVNCGEYKA